MVIVTANYESNQIINRKTYNLGNRCTNFSIRPMVLENIPQNVTIGTILYMAYWNLVFNITYFKILHGKWFFLKNIDAKLVLTKLFFMYFGISRLALKLFKHVFNLSKEENIEEYMYSCFNNCRDGRIIIKIDNVWKVNSGWLNFKKKITVIIHNEAKNISGESAESAANKFKMPYEKMREIQCGAKTFKALFADRNLPAKAHRTFLKAAKNSGFYGYQTSYQSAYANNFYNRPKLIKEYGGLTKKVHF